MNNPYCYFTVEGASGGFSDYKKKFNDLIDAVNDYIEHGYKDFPSCGGIYLHIKIADDYENIVKLR